MCNPQLLRQTGAPANVQMAKAGDVRTFGDNHQYESLGTDDAARNSPWDNITREGGKPEYWKKKAPVESPMV